MSHRAYGIRLGPEPCHLAGITRSPLSWVARDSAHLTTMFTSLSGTAMLRTICFAAMDCWVFGSARASFSSASGGRAERGVNAAAEFAVEPGRRSRLLGLGEFGIVGGHCWRKTAPSWPGVLESLWSRRRFSASSGPPTIPNSPSPKKPRSSSRSTANSAAAFTPRSARPKTRWKSSLGRPENPAVHRRETSVASSPSPTSW